MMAKRIIKTALTLAAVAAIGISTAFFAFPEKALQKSAKLAEKSGVFELRGAYRNACAVVEGVCVNSYVSPYGSVFSEYSIEKVISGIQIKAGDKVSVLSSDEIGQRRLLYLGHAVGDVHSENSEVYSVVEGGFLGFSEGKVLISGDTEIPLEFIENDISSLRSEVRLPSKNYYYGDIKSLVKNCASIFIGRVDRIEKHDDSELYVMDRGEIIKKTGEDCELSVTVLNGLLWQHGKGEELSVRLAADAENGLINYSTNEHFTPQADSIEPVEGGIYLFFVKDGPDEKAEHFFLVNPCQGLIEIEGERILANEDNALFADTVNLNELLVRLARAAGVPISVISYR